ncbi:hypothetical protein Zm00014a_033534 [Zea mays]|uniref:Uncharacterized protein n=1 Tax=Zea mays TaxID=4577 RepID=A0A317YJC6_MAIZE|nr:hypothetical protein Zm00014a_033534 [Zea mays]
MSRSKLYNKTLDDQETTTTKPFSSKQVGNWDRLNMIRKMNENNEQT